MRILLLCHSFNSLTQRLFVELTDRGHALSVEFDINDEVTAEAAELYRPDLIVATYLKRAIPRRVWERWVCLVVHPGIVGDRGPSALDRAMLRRETVWGVTVIQANGEMDAGDVWASVEFPMREGRKSSLYRHEVTEAACDALLSAVEQFERGAARPRPLDYQDAGVRGRWHPVLRQAERRIDWRTDDTLTVLRKIGAADGYPGVLDEIAGMSCYLFDAHAEDRLRGEPGKLLARRNGAVCRATVDGAVWLGHLRPKGCGRFPFKRPATAVLADSASALAEDPVVFEAAGPRETYRDVWYVMEDEVGYLYFDFYNGAMSTERCERLRDAFVEVRSRGPSVLVLMGGVDFFSNGIDLNAIEAADSPAEESWRNINAMDDLVEEIIRSDEVITIAALRGDAGAGGAFLALAADEILARRGVILNPHYKNMGNLYGSEYWTFLLPTRVGSAGVAAVMGRRLPMGVSEALALGLVDRGFSQLGSAFEGMVRSHARRVAEDPALQGRIQAKRERFNEQQRIKPLEAYRQEELARMRLNFYGFDPSYHVARYNFVYRRPQAWTPLHLARHRQRTRPIGETSAG